MDDEARKTAARERMRMRRSDPAFRAAEYAKNAEYRRRNRDVLRPKRLEAARRRYRENPESRAAMIGYSKENYRRLRSRLFAAYGNACACCGEDTKEFLELDHISGGGKKHFASHTSPVKVYREVERAGFPSDYRLLCANCNRGRQRNNGLCPHYVKDLAFIDVLAENLGPVVPDAR